MKKTLVYTNKQEHDEKIVFGVFNNFDCYIRFQFVCGILVAVNFKEKTKDGGFSTFEMPKISFGSESQRFYEAINNSIKANDYSIYLLDTPSDEMDFVVANILNGVDCCYIDPNHNVTLIEKDIALFNEKMLLEFVTIRKDNIRIELYSSENLGYEEPHVHVSVNNEKSYKISLCDNYKILKVYNKANSKTEKEIIKLIHDNIVKLRNRWNDFSNKIKFVVDENGNATSETMRL